LGKSDDFLFAHLEWGPGLFVMVAAWLMETATFCQAGMVWIFLPSSEKNTE